MKDSELKCSFRDCFPIFYISGSGNDLYSISIEQDQEFSASAELDNLIYTKAQEVVFIFISRLPLRIESQVGIAHYKSSSRL